MNIGIMRIEAFLRVCASLLLVTTACLVRLDTQTTLIFTSFSRTATFRDMNALFVLVFIDIAAAAYNLIQLVMRRLLSSYLNPDMKRSYIHVAWLTFLLDQVVVYMVFAATSTGLTASLLALTGEEDLFWMKLCDKFNRFCAQIGGAIFCGYTAFLFMVVVSSISAFGLFRHYSPKSFRDLK